MDLVEVSPTARPRIALSLERLAREIGTANLAQVKAWFSSRRSARARSRSPKRVFPPSPPDAADDAADDAAADAAADATDDEGNDEGTQLFADSPGRGAAGPSASAARAFPLVPRAPQPADLHEHADALEAVAQRLDEAAAAALAAAEEAEGRVADREGRCARFLPADESLLPRAPRRRCKRKAVCGGELCGLHQR